MPLSLEEFKSLRTVKKINWGEVREKIRGKAWRVKELHKYITEELGYEISEGRVRQVLEEWKCPKAYDDKKRLYYLVQ